MTSGRAALLGSVAAILATGATMAAPAGAARDEGRTGVAGHVVLRGDCGGPAACDDKPYSTYVAAYRGQRLVRSDLADERGRFRIRLSPGRYTLQSVCSPRPDMMCTAIYRPPCEPVDVRVPRRGFTRGHEMVCQSTKV